jgi:hypothetical protein
MTTIVDAFPGAEIVDFHALLPEGWLELVQQEINKVPNSEASKVTLDFWDGLTSVPGYGALRFMNETFYKTPHLFQSTWETALTYDANRLLAMFSRRLSNWAYASSRIQLSPVAWIDSGPTGFDAARDPAYVATQLAAFRQWGMGGTFADFAYSGLHSFDYTPYVPGMQAAAQPGVVDREAPGVGVGTVTRSGATVTASGSATDNMGIRVVRASAASGASGVARMVWTVVSGNYAVGYTWRMDWTVTIAVRSGEVVTVTAEDIKGLSSTSTFTAP